MHGRDGVIVGIEWVVELQQFALLREEQEDETHHDGQCCIIERLFIDIVQEDALAILIEPVQRLHKHLDSATHLIAKLYRHLLLVQNALCQQNL